MIKRYLTPLILTTVFAASTPAIAHCASNAPASSIRVSCESGVKVYRGQINGPDFRFAALQQARDIAEARAQRADERAQRQSREQAQITINQNSGAITPTFAGRRSFFTPFVQRGFGNFNPASTLPVRSNIGGVIRGGPGNSGTLRGGLGGSFGAVTLSAPASAPSAVRTPLPRVAASRPLGRGFAARGSFRARR